MEKYIYIFFICFSFVLLKEPEQINTSVYSFIMDKDKFLVYKDNIMKIIKAEQRFPLTGRFLLQKNQNNNYFFIENAISHLKLSVNQNLVLIAGSDLDKMEWDLIKSEGNNNQYIIKNVLLQCYITNTLFSVICQNNVNKAIKFEIKKYMIK